MGLTPGTRLGSYEILGSLGAGGMGEVYRARDPRLGREVAIKVLAGEFAADADALARFEREALSVAKLSHPNILSIFEFAKDGDRSFVVTELVDGETLRARLERGVLPARRAIAYALQIARGLAAAHARGIAHRDLKPENVMIGRDDQVKILDFGLAKSLDQGPADMTRVARGATSAGTVLGTFGYMAPEQVRAGDVDHRADMFAFGAVLYEMLSGQRAFKGDTAADTMAAVLSKEPPDLDAARLAIPPALDRIVRRCLEKSPDLRFQSANDLAFALETLSTVSTSSAPVVDAAPPRASAARAWLPWTVTAVALLAAAASWLVKRGPAQAEAHWATFTRITDAAGEETAPAMSPDGGTVLYAVRVNGQWDLYSQRVGGRNATAVVSDPQRNEGAPAYSPDGSQIAFHVSDGLGGIFIAGATGESVRRRTDVGFDPAWSFDGQQIAYGTEEVRSPYSRQSSSSVFVVDAGGGAPRKVSDEDAVQPSWSPSGDRIVYWSNTGGQRDIYTVAAKGGPRVAVTNDAPVDWSPVWSPDGRFIYFSSDRGGAMNVWRIAVDQSSGRPLGTPEPVTGGVQASAGRPRFSKDGSRLVFQSRVASVNPVGIPFDPAAERAGTPFLLDTRNNIRVPSDVSADGTLIAYFSAGERQEDLFIGSPGGPMRRITDDPARDRAPMFTPDGRALVFYSNRDGNWAGWMVGIDGGGLRRITGHPTGVVYILPSPKENTIVFSDAGATGIYSAPLAPDSTATPLPGTKVADKQLSASGWSPDGTRLVGALNSGTGQVGGLGVYEVGAHTTTPISTEIAPAARWLADSRRIVYFANNRSQLVVLDTVSRKRTVVDVRLPGPSANDTFAISPDNKTIYYGAERAEADIWIVERK